MSRVRVRGWWLAPALVAAMMAIPWPPSLIEAVYSRGLYPRLQPAVTAISNRVGFAVIDVLLVGGVVYLLWRFAAAVRRARRDGVLTALWELTRRVIRTAAVIALVFLANWGLNYRRVPLEITLRGAAESSVSAADVRQLADEAVAGARVTRPPDGGPADVRSFEAVAARLAGPFEQALRQLGMPAAIRLGRPKSSLVLTPFFTAAGVTGMVNPLALETIVHPDLLPFERPMVLAHEWAHLAGFADEADASAVGWLACTLGGTDLAYSADMFIVLETAGAMPRSDWQEVRAQLPPGAIRDIEALAARLEKQKPAVREQAFAVYDRYLKSNRVPDGVRSYSRVLRVLVAMREKS